MQQNENCTSQESPSISLNIAVETVDIDFPAHEFYKLSELREATRGMYESLSADSLRSMLDYTSWEVESKLKLTYITNVIDDAFTKDEKVIVAIDRSSSVDWVYQQAIEASNLDLALRSRIGMIDKTVSPEKRMNLITRFNRQNKNAMAVLFISSDAIMNGLLSSPTKPERPAKRNRIVFFDTLRNNPAALVEFANLFQLPQQTNPTKVEFLRINEPEKDKHSSFYV